MDFLTSIPRGKEDKPMLLMQEQRLLFNVDEKDGQLAMLDRDFVGSAVATFSKTMDPIVQGRVTLNGQEVAYTLKPMSIARGMWMLGIPVAGLANDYDTDYNIHVEGFTDTDGNIMSPVELVLHTDERKFPKEEYLAHDAVALQAAEEGIVLLKNENQALPLESGVINILGTGQNLFRIGIVGAGKINPRFVVNFKEAIRDSMEYELNETLSQVYNCGRDVFPEEDILKSAIKKSDTALIVLARTSGENLDNSSGKGEYCITDEEELLIKQTTEAFSKTAIILNSPYPMDVTFVEKYKVDALVYAGVEGMLGGQALFNILTGKVCPSGKLTDTWAKMYTDIPSSKNFYDCATDGPRLDADTDIWLDTVYEEDIYVGYRYFDTFKVKPAYPFGFGLSYTTFRVDTNQVVFDEKEGMRISVEVTNSGKTAGKEVVQIYVGKPDGILEQPQKELVEFDKTKLLEPGESQILNFYIPMSHLTSYDEGMAAYIIEAGTYTVYTGTSVEDAVIVGSFEVTQLHVMKQVKNRMVPVVRPKVLSKNEWKETYPTGEKSGVKPEVHKVEPARQIESYKVEIKAEILAKIQAKIEPEVYEKEILFKDVLDNFELALDYASQLTIEELARLTVCASSGWGMQDVGVAGRLARLENRDIPEMTVADGNSGVNVRIPNIGLPTSVVCCASFNKSLLKEIGRTLGEEAKTLGVDLMLIPAMNIHRNPLNGRHAEYFSEDPYLAGVMAGNICIGMAEVGVGTCYKHCIANNCEASRKRNQSIITERAIRDIYFKAFEIAMEIQMPDSIMTAYNAVNGVHCAADLELIRGMFREENGFDGFVMIDWNSYDTCDIAEMIAGGNNWITPGSKDDKFTSQIELAVAEGRLSKDCLIESVAYIIGALAKLQNK